MKRISIFLVSLLASMFISGCNSGNTSSNKSTNDSVNETTLFLEDEEGFSYGGIPYKCTSMSHWSKTKANGEFTFVQPDTCTFNFNGLKGLYEDEYDDVVRIVDYTHNGKGDISYDCRDFGASSTYDDGSFSYNEDDECTFQL